MSTKQEEVKEVPIVYPLISITLRTVSIVNGRVIDNECEEIIDMDQLTPTQAAAAVVQLLGDFETYVSKVAATANSPEGQDELQRILDQNARPQPLPSEDLPSSLSQVEDPAQGRLPLAPPAA